MTRITPPPTTKDIGVLLRAERRARAEPSWDRRRQRDRVRRRRRLVAVVALLVALAAALLGLVPDDAPGPHLTPAGAQALDQVGRASPTPKHRMIEPNAPWEPWMMADANTMTPEGIAALALATGCDPEGATIATAVGLGESSGDTDAVGDETLVNGTWGPSVGVWQLRSMYEVPADEPWRDGDLMLHDGWANAWGMTMLSQHCSQWGDWSAYTNGSYLKHLPAAAHAVLWVMGAID